VEPPKGWYGRPVTAAAILLAVLSLSSFFLLRLRLGPASEQRYSSFTVVLEHFGVDSRQIERTLTRPLEDAIAGIPGIIEMHCTSEYGKARVVVLSEAGARDSVFLRLRDAVERVYVGLPASVQKPQIISSSVSRRPVFVAALQAPGWRDEDLFQWAETRIKPSFQKIAGVGEVEIGGGEIREIHVRIDPQKAAQRGLAFPGVALQLQSQDLLLPAGALRSPDRELPIFLAGKLGKVENLARLPLCLPGGGTLPLSQIAEAEYGAREKESISRVDGRQAVVISVQSSGTANLIAVSRALRAEAEGWRAKGLELQIILDRGKVLEQALFRLIRALLAGLLGIMLLLTLFIAELRRLAMLALSLPATGLLALGALAAAGLSLDEHILAGLAVGMGTIIGTAVILSGQHGAHGVRAAIPPLFSSLTCTMLILVPLFFLEFLSPGIRQVAIAIGLILLASFGLSLIFLPAFTLAGSDRERLALLPRARRVLGAHFKRKAVRGFQSLIGWVFRRRISLLAGGLVLTLGMVLALAASGKDFSPLIQDDSVFAHIELEPQATVESADERTLAYARELSAVPGVELIESIARSGSAEMAVRFDPARLSRERLARLMQAYGRRIPGGFAYLPEGSSLGERAVELAIIGEDDALLKQLAHAAALEISKGAWARQVVLNFKNPAPALILAVDHRKAAEYGLQTSDIAETLRWALHGPVALKWIDKDRELDLRVMERGSGTASRRSILRLPLVSSRGERLEVGSLVQPRMEPEGAKIYRLNRQRAVFLTLHVSGRGFEKKLQEIRRALGRISLPKGYAFELDREVIRLAASYRSLGLALGLVTLFLYIILAALSESLGAPLLILSMLPCSLAFPVLASFLLGQAVGIPILLGLIMLSGTVLTSSILIVGDIRRRLAGLRPATQALRARTGIRLALRKWIQPLLITSCAAGVGMLPLLFTRVQGKSFTSALAFVMLWGVLGSLFSMLFILPSLCSLFPALLRRASPESSRGEASKC
jgi:HAE1 family hydrophobic/amphiphilic exporter-1